MSLKASLLLASLLPLSLSAACTSSLTGGGELDPGPNEPGEPGDPGGPDSARIDGSYQVRSLINFSESTAGLAGVLNSLDNLSDDPAGTLIDILEASGNDFLDGVPGVLKDLFASKVNDFIKSKDFDGQKVTKILSDYGTMIGEMTQRFHAVSELTVGQPDAAGNAIATHGVVAVEFTYAGRDMVVEVGSSTMSESISVLADSNNAVNIGSHELSLPLGQLAFEALQISLQQNTGSPTIAAALGLMVDCTGLAQNVGDIQLSGFTLVSINQIDQLCEQGLQLVGAKLEEQFANANVSLEVVGGTGSAEASSGSVQSLRGNWDLKVQTQALASTFEASRM